MSRLETKCALKRPTENRLSEPKSWTGGSGIRARAATDTSGPSRPAESSASAVPRRNTVMIDEDGSRPKTKPSSGIRHALAGLFSGLWRGSGGLAEKSERGGVEQEFMPPARGAGPVSLPRASVPVAPEPLPVTSEPHRRPPSPRDSPPSRSGSGVATGPDGSGGDDDGVAGDGADDSGSDRDEHDVSVHPGQADAVDLVPQPQGPLSARSNPAAAPTHELPEAGQDTRARSPLPRPAAPMYTTFAEVEKRVKSAELATVAPRLRVPSNCSVDVTAEAPSSTVRPVPVSVLSTLSPMAVTLTGSRGPEEGNASLTGPRPPDTSATLDSASSDPSDSSEAIPWRTSPHEGRDKRGRSRYQTLLRSLFGDDSDGEQDAMGAEPLSDGWDLDPDLEVAAPTTPQGAHGHVRDPAQSQDRAPNPG